MAAWEATHACPIFSSPNTWRPRAWLQIHASRYIRRRHREFLGFMNRVVSAHPERAIHVVLDSLNTHKPNRCRWLARHLNAHLHHTPVHAAWLTKWIWSAC